MTIEGAGKAAQLQNMNYSGGNVGRINSYAL